MRKSVTKAILDAYLQRKGVMLSAGFKGDQTVHLHEGSKDYTAQLNKALRIQQICNYKTDIRVVEALIETSGNLKLCLVEINQGRFHVFEVTVHHEDTRYLEAGYSSKFDTTA